MMKASLALLCLALACTAYAADINVSDLHQQLQAVDPSLAAISSSKASTMSVDKGDYYKDDYYKYEKKYEDKYGKYEKKYDDKYGKYEDKYEKKYEDKYEDKYEKKYDDKYEKKYDDEHEKKYDDKYAKYEDKYSKDKYDDKYYDYKHTDYYGSYGPEKKITLKLWEKSRGPLRPQKNNVNTWQFSSVVTCDNPKAVKDIHSNDGIIDIPVNPELKVTPVGVCEWTVTEVAAQEISAHATIKGSTSVVCTFTEEAERTCKGDFLCDKLSISAAGLLYHFDKAPADYGYEYKKDEYKKEEPELDMDVMLSLVNGVNGHKHKTEFDNGVLQFYYGAAAETDKAAIKYAIKDSKDATGEYTIVLKD